VVLVVGVVLALTLRPEAGPRSQEFVRCLLCGPHGSADAVANVLLFLPVGVALHAALRSARLAWLLAALLSLGIEALQFLVPGRDPSLGDLAFNSLGAALGVVLVRHAELLLRPGRRVARRLVLLAATADLGLCLVVGGLLEPALTRATYLVEWNQTTEYLAFYHGRVLQAAIGGVPLHPGFVSGSDRARGLFLGGTPLRLEAVAGPPTRSLAQLLGVYDPTHPEVLLVGPDGDDVVVRYLRRADDAGFHVPDLRLRDALSGVEPGDTFRVRVRLLPHGLTIAVLGRGEHHHEYTVGDGWKLLLPSQGAPPAIQAFLSVLWVAALLLPLGLWLRADLPSALAVAALLLALHLLPAVTALGRPSPRDLGAMLLGLGLGLALRRLLERRSPAPPAAPGAAGGVTPAGASRGSGASILPGATPPSGP
jgi:hypothetical protein